MPRLPRLHVPGGCYHVVLRGNHREDLFATADDRYALNGIVAKASEQYGARVHAFCWMTNHLHVLVQIKDVPLGKVMQQIVRRYSRYRHRQLNTSGHLFERRYKAWLVDTDSYFIALLRYIHRNPGGLAWPPALKTIRGAVIAVISARNPGRGYASTSAWGYLARRENRRGDRIGA